MKMAIRLAWLGVGWVMPKVLMKMLASHRRGFIGWLSTESMILEQSACKNVQADRAALYAQVLRPSCGWRHHYNSKGSGCL